MVKRVNVKKIEKEKKRQEIFSLFPILFLTTIFLFLVRVRLVYLNRDDVYWFIDSERVIDLYACFRMQCFVFITVVFILYLLYCVWAEEIKISRHKVYIPMAAYALLAVVSYVFSEYKSVALLGAAERFEGTAVLVCYMLILFYAMHAIRSEYGVKLIMKCFSIACVILGIWAILQTFTVRMGELPKWLFMSPDAAKYMSLEGSRNATMVTWFFSNQNYASFFMVFPICLFGMACIAQEKRKWKIAYAALTGLMLYSLWNASSLGGMVGLAAAVLAAVLIAGPERIRKWRGSLGMLFLATVVSMAASVPAIMKEIDIAAVQNILGIDVAYAADADNKKLSFVELDYILTEDEDIVFSFAGDEIKIHTEDGMVRSVTDAEGNPIAADSKLLRVSNDGSDGSRIEVKTARRTWQFVTEDGEVYYRDPRGNLVTMDHVESIGFENNLRFATNRGYIWSRTLPLLKETFLIGKGADTFVFYFPHDDFAGRYNVGFFTDSTNRIVDKPHNMYLGAAVNTGVVSMIALIAIYVIYLIESIKIYRKHTFEAFQDYIGMGICIAVAGFMVSGLVNDSTVQMMPVVYAFLGMGFAINRMVKKGKE